MFSKIIFAVLAAGLTSAKVARDDNQGNAPASVACNPVAAGFKLEDIDHNEYAIVRRDALKRGGATDFILLEPTVLTGPDGVNVTAYATMAYGGPTQTVYVSSTSPTASVGSETTPGNPATQSVSTPTGIPVANSVPSSETTWYTTTQSGYATTTNTFTTSVSGSITQTVTASTGTGTGSAGTGTGSPPASPTSGAPSSLPTAISSIPTGTADTTIVTASGSPTIPSTSVTTAVTTSTTGHSGSSTTTTHGSATSSTTNPSATATATSNGVKAAKAGGAWLFGLGGLVVMLA
ncbi:hypothetical protein DL546_007935 [Coniochaeta pulveracea]|uniref:Uncharacterized protein n=1 Tax=Coniochaeta pulveracea TaxID=177199 RepID=A0A420YG39_9PEZI|nr:hypothetical protein DL546_007935 [Coniochaeta pulveracea]